MAEDEQFRTVRGYQIMRQEKDKLSPSMEDYLEMIYRICQKEDYARVHNLAELLSVQAPSVSRVLRRLRDKGFVRFRRYGIIQLTESGREMGEFLLRRHKAVEEFLRSLGVTESLLVDTELIEHQISETTLVLLELMNDFFLHHPQVLADFQKFKRARSSE